jgi:ferrochelatase
VREWYGHADYQQAIVECIQAEARRLPDPDPARIELLFSAHGLPKKLVERGDPYEQQIRATFEALRARLGWPHTTLCYQSRVGPLEWLRPYTEDVIKQKAAGGCRQMLVYPIAFVSDHSETLYELGIQYALLAKQSGIAHYRVVPALNEHPLLVRTLTDLVLHSGDQP